MKKDLAIRACQMEAQAAQASLESALNDVEATIRAIRTQIGHKDMRPGQGRRLVTDSAEVLQHMTTLATLATCQSLIGRGDQE